MKSHLKTEINNTAYTWLYQAKYTFYASLLSIALLILYSICFAILANTTISSASAFSTLKGNFDHQHFSSHLFSHIIFYIFFEEFVFRKSLVISVRNLAITLPLILYISFQSFIASDSLYLFIYSLYALFIIVIYKRSATSKWIQKVNIALSVLALCAFHLSKFSLNEVSFVELIWKNAIPILIIGIGLAHLRIKFNSYVSVLVYFIIALVANIL